MTWCGRAQRSEPHLWAGCYFLSQCVPGLIVPMASINGYLLSASGYAESRGTIANETKVWHHLPGKKMTQKHWILNVYSVIVQCRLSFDSTQGREDQIFVFNLMLLHGFLNKWMFCAGVWRKQVLESGKSELKSWLLFYSSMTMSNWLCTSRSYFPPW